MIPRIKAMLGDEREFELGGSASIPSSAGAGTAHGRVLFVGDAAHQVSPFGARGANSGIQDTDNLAWKLKLVIDGRRRPEGCSTPTPRRVFAAADET